MAQVKCFKIHSTFFPIWSILTTIYKMGYRIQKYSKFGNILLGSKNFCKNFLKYFWGVQPDFQKHIIILVLFSPYHLWVLLRNCHLCHPWNMSILVTIKCQRIWQIFYHWFWPLWYRHRLIRLFLFLARLVFYHRSYNSFHLE